MSPEVTLTDLPVRHYVAIRSWVKMQEVPSQLPPLISEILGWLDNKNLEQTSPVFFRYLEMSGEMLLVDVGVCVDKEQKVEGRILADQFPSGKYACTTYYGPYDRLNTIHRAMENWGKENNVDLRGRRTEFYPTDPKVEPDPKRWRTDIEVELL